MHATYYVGVGVTPFPCRVFRSSREFILGLFVCFLGFGASRAQKPTSVPAFKRVCYFTNWSCDLLEKEAHFCLRHIDASLCSHLIYGFVDINVTSLTLTPSRVDDETKDGIAGRYILFNNLKQSHPHLKTLLSVGGSYQSEGFKAVTSSAASRVDFAARSVAYVRRWGFDGLDVDWEYPDDRDAVSLLLKDLRESDDTERITSSGEKTPLILSVAGPASEELVDTGFNVKDISRYVDFINLMAYDLQGSWSHVTGFNSPLYPRANDSRFTPEHCVEWVVDMWMRKGAPSSKIVLGIAGYGQSYKLAVTDSEGTSDDQSTVVREGEQDYTGPSSNQAPTTTKTTAGANTRTVGANTIALGPFPGPGSHAVGPGKAGRLRHLKGQLSYPEICEYIDKGGDVSWDTQQRVPFMSYQDLWVGYDDTRSVIEKVTWAYNRGLGGAMFWSLDLDDFTGNYCNQGRYPLLTAMSNTAISLDSPDTTVAKGDRRSRNSDKIIPTEFVVVHGEVQPVKIHRNMSGNIATKNEYQGVTVSVDNNDNLMGSSEDESSEKSNASDTRSFSSQTRHVDESERSYITDERRSYLNGTRISEDGGKRNKSGRGGIGRSKSRSRYRNGKKKRNHQTAHFDKSTTRTLSRHDNKSKRKMNGYHEERNLSPPRRRAAKTKRYQNHTLTQNVSDAAIMNTVTSAHGSRTPHEALANFDDVKWNERHHQSQSNKILTPTVTTTTSKGSTSESYLPPKSIHVSTTTTTTTTTTPDLDSNSLTTINTNTGSVSKNPRRLPDHRRTTAQPMRTQTSTNQLHDIFSLYDTDENDPSSQFDYYYVAFKLPEVTQYLSTHPVLPSSNSSDSAKATTRNEKNMEGTNYNELTSSIATTTNISHVSSSLSSSSSAKVHNSPFKYLMVMIISFVLSLI